MHFFILRVSFVFRRFIVLSPPLFSYSIFYNPILTFKSYSLVLNLLPRQQSMNLFYFALSFPHLKKLHSFCLLHHIMCPYVILQPYPTCSSLRSIVKYIKDSTFCQKFSQSSLSWMNITPWYNVVSRTFCDDGHVLYLHCPIR